MAQQNFMFDDDGRIVSGVNGNTTSAITAGDLLYASAPSTSPFGTTVPANVEPSEVEVEPVKFATATVQGRKLVGIAMHDAVTSTTTLEPVSFATEGLFLSKVGDTTGAIQPGRFVRAYDGTTTAGVTNAGTTSWGTTAQYSEAEQSVINKIGFALTGANVDGDYVLWKFTK